MAPESDRHRAPARPDALSLGLARGSLRCSVDREAALLFLGYRGQSVDRELLDRLEAAASLCESENTPRFAWRTAEIDPAPSQGGGQIVLAGCDLALPGESIGRHLRDAGQAALLAVTLGHACQRTAERLQASSPVDALLYDACASSLTEEAANAAHLLLADAAREAGLEARARFSPGYGDLPLDVHPAFLRALDAERELGMYADASNLLQPAKSITAVIGLFPRGCADGGDDVNSCPGCAAFCYCNFREAGTTCRASRQPERARAAN